MDPESDRDVRSWGVLKNILNLFMDRMICRRLGSPLIDVPDWLPFHLHGYLKYVSAELCFGPGLRTMFDPLDYNQDEVDEHFIDDLDFCCLSGGPLRGVFIIRSYDDTFYDVVVLAGTHAGSVWNTDNMSYCRKIHENLLTYLLAWVEYLAGSYNVAEAQSYLCGADG